MIDEGHIDFNGFAHAGIRKVVGDVVSIRFVGQLLANLGQIIRTIGIVAVPPQPLGQY